MFRCFIRALLWGLLWVASVGRADEGDFDSGGVKIHYRVEGKGEPVLLVHGFASTVYLQWVHPDILRALARDHRVIALDVRGHGQSGKPTDPNKYGTEMVEDCVRLLDHLKIHKAHVVGYSMGTLIVGKLLAVHPDRLLSAVLGGSGVFVEGTELPPFVEKLADSLEKGQGLGPMITALWLPSKPPLPPSTIQLLNRTLIGDNSKALAASVRSWKKLGVRREQLRANKVPTLVLIGANDPLKKRVDDSKDDMANLKIVVIEGADHNSTLFDPKFTRSLRQFLAEHSQKTTPERARAR
jgi:pimeloyl-ACP methyl ester carboxylesterase